MTSHIIIASDHRGLKLKEHIKTQLQDKFNILDTGCFTNESVDYNDYAEIACREALQLEKPAIIICGSGVGMSIAANRIKGIRCAVCHNVETAITARKHNNINVLSLGADMIAKELALDIVKAFLETEFINEDRYVRRNCKLDDC